MLGCSYFEQMNTMNKVLVVVDELYDFIDGSMACQNGEESVRRTVDEIEKYKASMPVLFVCDHHPADHCSFVEQGGPWPPHCVAGTRGAEIHESLRPYVEDSLVFYKGCDPALEQYSGFDGRNEAGQSLAEVLRLLDAELVYVAGIATEYCVRSTAEDLHRAGFNVTILKDCLAYVELEGHLKALPEIAEEGIRII